VDISPDATIIFDLGFVQINATIFYTWLIMALLVITSWLITRNLRMGEGNITRGQNILEMIVIGISSQIRDASNQKPEPFLPFIGTLFIFIATSNILSAVPVFQPPTGSLSTTAAFAICVFIAVPVFGIADQGVVSYLKQYLYPNIIMLPFNVIGELSRTLALAVRLFGNVMSGTMIGAILLSIVPLFFPVIMQLFGILIGIIQAYIFAVLAMVYIASALRSHDEKHDALEQKSAPKFAN
jgi:F-type H+-transporting ATPase subunit a